MNHSKKLSKVIRRSVVLGFAASFLALGVSACSSSANTTPFTQEGSGTPDTADFPAAQSADAPVADSPTADSPTANLPPSSNPPIVSADPTPSVTPTVSSDNSSNKIKSTTADSSRRGVKKVITTLEEVEATINVIKENHSLLILDAQIEFKKVHDLLSRGLLLNDAMILQQFSDELIPLTQKMQNIRQTLGQINPSLNMNAAANLQQDSFVGKVQMKVFENIQGPTSLNAEVLGDRLINLYKTSIFSFEDENGDLAGFVSFFDFSKNEYAPVNVRDLSFLTDIERSL
jgi:hypothetical protein